MAVKADCHRISSATPKSLYSPQQPPLLTPTFPETEKAPGVIVNEFPFAYTDPVELVIEEHRKTQLVVGVKTDVVCCVSQLYGWTTPICPLQWPCKKLPEVAWNILL